MTLYRLCLNNITAGIEVSPDGIITDAAPVLRRYIGCPLAKMQEWAKSKGGTLGPVGKSEINLQEREDEQRQRRHPRGL
jgi:hypothetical protein